MFIEILIKLSIFGKRLWKKIFPNFFSFAKSIRFLLFWATALCSILLRFLLSSLLRRVFANWVSGAIPASYIFFQCANKSRVTLFTYTSWRIAESPFSSLNVNLTGYFFIFNPCTFSQSLYSSTFFSNFVFFLLYFKFIFLSFFCNDRSSQPTCCHPDSKSHQISNLNYSD